MKNGLKSPGNFVHFAERNESPIMKDGIITNVLYAE